MRGIVKLFARTLSAAAVVGLVAGAPSPGLAARTCNGLLTIDYVAGQNFAKPGDVVRVELTIGTGSIQNGSSSTGTFTLNRLRFDLDCNADFTLGIPCTDEGAIVEYEGDSTITTTCGVTWATSHAVSDSPNEVVFTPNVPLVIAANRPAFCALQFDVKVLAPSIDSTPGQIQETTGYETSQNDASCDNGLTSGGQQSSSIPLCNCPSTVCVDSVCNQDTGACSNTPKPNSTPCPDTDNDPCTTAGCDPNGQCDQRHMVCVTTTTTTPTTTTTTPTTTTTTTTTPTTTTTTTTTPTTTTTTTTETPTTTTTTTSTVQTTTTTTTSTTTTTNSVGGCRVTGGGRIADTNPDVDYGTHGGQVGAPVGFVTAFSPSTPCIHGNWTHVRHTRSGNFHSKSFDSLMCGCLPCDENPTSPGQVGNLCNPGDRICGPEPPRAPANKICFTGLGKYTMTSGRRDLDVAFRVDVEDRSEPGGTNGTPPPDHYRMRIWILDGAVDSPSNLDLRQAISCGASLDEDINAPVPPDVDDGGIATRGNLQIHPEINNKPCP